MKITYTGKPEGLTPAENRKIEAKFAKLAKLLDARKGEREARVILSQERHLNHAEITVRYQDRDLVGVGSAADTYSAMGLALEKLEKQILRLRERVRDSHRGPKPETELEAPAGAEAEAEAAEESETETAAAPQVFRVNHHAGQKPMTLDEALLAIEGRNYVVYHDAESGRVSVLVRRRDGNFDLIQA
ncbi:MAG TPA: ribosome-associated translation inhibitor RaiA [Bryobacteraceae bacterium]|nr:ribosome-associated translation inhibitor RaiA [Bryobacteraceae bacterium]HOL71597.1 ribosome-associated translation inhibitor RaiA [Bryobacteraceae bacterium]HOQ46938.1 ribosome-associated translation inhibitor RaiA [Bryobacteraceae bacterium]HPQ15253.1 ribosome-associated translation inhibitor RaiA [Bryobacteraceae bacterium]HPU73135.1 ribosome-associated translation inhibitor RaiA [Bryobacteraceae bacterium]